MAFAMKWQPISEMEHWAKVDFHHGLWAVDLWDGKRRTDCVYINGQWKKRSSSAGITPTHFCIIYYPSYLFVEKEGAAHENH